jgi:Flp pilus assembly protein CpaB
MEKKQRSPITIIGFAVIIGVLVIALLNGTIRPTQVLVAKTGLLAGTVLTADLVELRSIPAGGVPSDALKSVDELGGQMLTVGRAAGDFITQGVLGELAASGIPSQLPPGHVAMAVKVNMASGVAGLLREGQTVTVIGFLSPDVISNTLTSKQDLQQQVAGIPTPYAAPDLTGTPATPTATPTPLPLQATLGKLVITGLRVLLVPQQFRYQELPPDSSSSEEVFVSASSASTTSVIVLDVPTTPVEIAPGMFVNPATLLASLDEYGKLHLALEPSAGLQAQAITLNLGELYEALNNNK